MKKYKLVDKKPVFVEDAIEWATWFEAADRVVKQEEIGPYRVSTVFLGLDHSFGHGPPLLFETMTFCEGKDEDYQERCSTWEGAEIQHEKAVAFAKGLIEETA